MSSKKFASSTKMNYFRGVKSNAANIPGSTFYGNLYGNSLQLNRIYGFLKNHPAKNVTPTPPPPTVTTKIAAILNFNDQVFDVPIINTLNYYFNAVPVFYRFPIANTNGDIETLLNLLDDYYNKGYRYFLTATISPELLEVMDWFNFHPSAQAVSLSSRFTGLSIPKTIFRMLYPDITNTTFKEIGNSSYNAIFFIYNNKNDACIEYNANFEALAYENNIPYYSWPVDSEQIIVNTNFVNDTMNEIQQIISENNYTKTSLSSALSEWQDFYYNKFDYATTTVPSGATFYNITVNLPTISEQNAQTYFLNVEFYAQTSGNLGTSLLWREGLNALGQSNFSTTTLNAMQLLYKLDKSKGYSSELGAYSEALIFDQVTRDQIYESYVYSLYSNDNIFVPRIVYFKEDNGVIFKGYAS